MIKPVTSRLHNHKDKIVKLRDKGMSFYRISKQLEDYGLHYHDETIRAMDRSVLIEYEADVIRKAKGNFIIMFSNQDGELPIKYNRIINWLEQYASKLEQCNHGKGLTDYCQPCGRVNWGG